MQYGLGKCDQCLMAVLKPICLNGKYKIMRKLLLSFFAVFLGSFFKQAKENTLIKRKPNFHHIREIQKGFVQSHI